VSTKYGGGATNLPLSLMVVVERFLPLLVHHSMHPPLCPRRGRTWEAEDLLDNFGAEVNRADPFGRYAALHWAALMGQVRPVAPAGPVFSSAVRGGGGVGGASEQRVYSRDMGRGNSREGGGGACAPCAPSSSSSSSAVKVLRPAWAVISAQEQLSSSAIFRYLLLSSSIPRCLPLSSPIRLYLPCTCTAQHTKGRGFGADRSRRASICAGVSASAAAETSEPSPAASPLEPLSRPPLEPFSGAPPICSRCSSFGTASRLRARARARENGSRGGAGRASARPRKRSHVHFA